LLIMSIESQPADGSSSVIIPVQYDSSLHDFLTPPLGDLTSNIPGRSVAYEHRLSDSEAWVTFLGGVGLDSTSSIVTTPLQIYRANIARATYDTVTPMIQAALPITNDGMAKQLPAIADNGDVIYMARSMTSVGTDPDSWSIYLIPATGGQPQFLANGVSPQWVDSDTVLYMADDGLRAFHIKGRYADKVWGTQSMVTDKVTINVSRDKRMIAVAFPGSGETQIFRSLDGTLNNLTLRGTISAPASYPVISPDDSTLALQTMIQVGSNVVPEVQFYDLETLQQISGATIDIGEVLPAIEASAQVHGSAHAASGQGATAGDAGNAMITIVAPSAVVLTDWIP
jgi:hypothetical protein